MRDPPTGHIIIHEGASLIQVFSHYTKFPRGHTGGGVRGEISGFSMASRKRMMIALNKIRESALRNSKLITLTYHRNEIPADKIKQDFKSFRERLRRNHPQGSGIWKLEQQKRGSPHFHILWFGGFICKDWVARSWNEIAEPGDNSHLAAGTQVESARHADCVGRYLTKYLGKPTSETAPNVRALHGLRYWGFINRAGIPYATTRIIPLSGNAAREIIEFEYAARSLGDRGSTVECVNLFQPGARGNEQWLHRLKSRSND